MNAKEYIGVLLVMAAILHSTDGKSTVAKKLTAEKVGEWSYLLEIVLCWEAFLSQPEINKRLMGGLGVRNRLIMWLIKKTAFRQVGMGLKLMKYHAITHLAQDIHSFGVPSNVDTGSDESGHKKTKVAAKMTQKNRATFELQTATRESEFLVIDHAISELNGRRIWDYYQKADSDGDKSVVTNEDSIHTGETTINIFVNEANKPCYSVGVGKESRNPAPKKWDVGVVDFLHQLQNMVGRWMNGKLEVRSDHRRGENIYRGHPNYRSTGEPWKDWAVIDCGPADGEQCCQIWCFVVLTNLPTSNKKRIKHKDRLNFGSCELSNGVYAVVERTKRIASEVVWNDRPQMLFRKLQLQTDGNKRQFFLSNTDSIAEPCFVIPDFGCQDRRTFYQIANRNQWSTIFGSWMELALPAAYLNDKEGRQFH